MHSLGWSVPLKYLTAEEVADTLILIFCRLGFPDVHLSEKASQFVSWTMRSFTDMLSNAQTFSSWYHPQSNGVIKNFHSSLKQMPKITAQFPEDRDRYFLAVLFAYWEVPQKSTVYSANELVYGGPIRGLLSILRDMRVQLDMPEYKTYNTYIAEVRKRIITGCRLARENLEKACELQCTYCKNRKLNSLKANDGILIMVPDKVNISLSSWKGTFKDTKRCSTVNYVVDVRGNHKIFHINMLKKYFTTDWH